MSKRGPIKTVEEKEKQFRIFISTVNTLVGQAVVENMRNDNYNDENPHIIIGTVDKADPTPACRGVKRIIGTDDPKILMRVFLDCDVIIYDALKAAPDEIQFALKTLTSFNYTENKTFILISSVLSWSDTPPKEFIDENTGEAIEVTSIKTGKTGRTYGTQNTENSQEIKDPLKTHYTDKEHNFRRALPAYEYLRSLENQTMAAGRSKENLKTYVLCSGVTYGNGEDSLYDIIESAYQAENPLVLVGDGRNRIPMIHAVDLSNIVKKLVYEQPNDLEYINAIDCATNRTQAKLINTISEAMGGLEVNQMTYLEAIFYDDYNIQTININLIPTDILINQDDLTESVEKHRTYAEGEKKQFVWKYRSGFCENFDKIYEEYKTFRNLKTIKLGVLGLSSTHVNLYGEDLAKKLRIPYINYEKLVVEVQTRDDPLGRTVKEYLTAEKERMVKEAQDELEKLKAKKKKGIPDAVNPADYIPKLNLEMINKIFAWRLNKSDCKNKGYVLENYPTTRIEANELFIEKIPIKNEVIEEIEPEGTLNELSSPTGQKPPEQTTKDTKGAAASQPQIPELKFELRPRHQIMPDKIVYVSAESGIDLMTHLKQVLGEEVVNAELQITQESVDQKVLEWNQKLTPENNSSIDFFKEHNIEIFSVNVRNFDAKQKVMQYIGEKIEFNLAEPEVEEEMPLHESQVVDESQIKPEDQVDLAKKEGISEEQLNMSLEEVKHQEQEILNQKSQALKQYITDNLLPALTSGLIDICNQKPEDPLDSLADYLIAMSQKKSTSNS